MQGRSLLRVCVRTLSTLKLAQSQGFTRSFKKHSGVPRKGEPQAKSAASRPQSVVSSTVSNAAATFATGDPVTLAPRRFKETISPIAHLNG
jgi:polygalacturonase